jgi:hypothetical protein
MGLLYLYTGGGAEGGDLRATQDPCVCVLACELACTHIQNYFYRFDKD